LAGDLALDGRVTNTYALFKNGKVCWFNQRAKVGEKIFRLFYSSRAGAVDVT